jgi:hypothetical protein
MINRHYTIASDQARLFAIGFINANAQALIDAGTPLHCHFTDKPPTRSSEQNSYYWGMLLKQISEQVIVAGRKLKDGMWHIYFAEKFLPWEEKDTLEKDDETGAWMVIKKPCRQSTTGLSVADFAKYNMQVEAFAATELGVRFTTLEQF